jgi:hypothetical protein
MAAQRTEVADLRDEFVVCRALGHAWDDNPSAAVDGEWLAFSVGVLALRCTRCTTERLDYIGKDLGVAYRRYLYPDHYQSVPGQGTRPNLRGELLRRSLLIRAR